MGSLHQIGTVREKMKIAYIYIYTHSLHLNHYTFRTITDRFENSYLKIWFGMSSENLNLRQQVQYRID